MTAYGAVRHGPDIRADDTVKEAQSLLTQQTLTNIYDSQKGRDHFRFKEWFRFNMLKRTKLFELLYMYVYLLLYKWNISF
jgi:hypothetical protein